MNTTVTKAVSLDLHFSWDLTRVMVGTGWPTVVFDDSAPLSNASNSLKVALQEASLGTFDPDTGHMDLPLRLGLDYAPDFVLGKRDQDIEITLSTKGITNQGNAGLRLWQIPPNIGLAAEISYETKSLFGYPSVHTLGVVVSGSVSPLPPLSLVQGRRPVVCSSDPGEDRLDVLVRGVDNAIWYSSFGGNPWSQSAWQSLGGVWASDPAVAVLGPSLIYVFARGTDNALWYKSVSLSRGTAGPSGWTSLGGVLTSGPGACSTGPDRLEVFVRGTDNALWHRAFDGRAWTDWVSLGGTLTSDPGVMAMDGTAWVFARGFGNSLDFKWLRSPNEQSGWQHRDGVLTSAPVVCSVAPENDQFHVFAGRIKDSLQHTSFDGRSWSEWAELGKQSASGPGTTVIGGTAWVVIRGTDDALYLMFLRSSFDRSQWQRLDTGTP